MKNDAPAARSQQIKGVTSSELAALFDCTVSQIEMWAKEGLVVRIGRGRYDQERSTTRLVRHLREQAAGRAGIDSATDTAGANRERSLEQAALARAKRLRLEGQLIEVETVKEIWARIIRGVRQFVLALPGSIAHEIPTLTPHDIKAMKRICSEALADASVGRGFDIAGLEDTGKELDVRSSAVVQGDVGATGAAAADQPVAMVGTELRPA